MGIKIMKISTTMLLLLSFLSANAQINTYSQWQDAGKPVLPTGQANTINAPLGTLTTYADLATFQAAAPAAVFEDFEGGLVAAGGVAVCIPPVNSASNDPCFTPGDLITGFDFIVSTPSNSAVTLGAGFIGNASVVLGAATFTDITIVDFTTPVDAIAFDVTTNGPNPITVRAFDASATVIGTINTAVTAQGALTFVGFSSTTPIARITIADDTGGGELIDNLGFGTLAPLIPPATPVPSLSLTSLIIMLLLLVTVTLGYRKYTTK